MNPLDGIVSAQKQSEAVGIPSICSAHPLVLEAALRHSRAHDRPVLIEATCNQVNQFGGYTGMKPADFVRFVHEITERAGFDPQNLMLGGDHLGPLVWAGEPVTAAMDKAKELVREYVRAGFTKIHLDCSMPCADDGPLTFEEIARREAELAAVAEDIAGKNRELLRYVIGSEVPPAGGARAGEAELQVSSPADAAKAIETSRAAFADLKLEDAWERVRALVVQPGVDFGSDEVHAYDPAAAAGISRFIETCPGIVYEAHSTDYQTRSALRAMVEDHFAILKVGPRLTYAFREAVFALAGIESEFFEGAESRVRETLEAVMAEHPDHWSRHYTGTSAQKKFSRAYSFSDRIRYYWPDPRVQEALNRLLTNLESTQIPLTLISQYLPRQYARIREGTLANRPRELLSAQVMDVLDDYLYACEG